MNDHEFTITGNHGGEIAVSGWSTDHGPKAVVVIAHGAAEHGARYGRFAQRLVAAGYDVAAPDHRGHGRTAKADDTFGLVDEGGWDGIIDDLHNLVRHVGSEHPATPIVLIGHSMGSFLAQAAVQRWGDEVDALVLSGSTGALELDDQVAELVTSLAADAPDAPSEVFGAMFAGFNEPFAADSDRGVTGFEWLSRDPVEVAAYVEDPWCGFPLSNRFVAEMLGGNASTWSPEAESRIPTDLPVLVTSGGEDPVGGGTGVPGTRLLAQRWRELGLDVTLQVYDGARHEILNEVNRDEVMADIIGWIDDAVAP